MTYKDIPIPEIKAASWVKTARLVCHYAGELLNERLSYCLQKMVNCKIKKARNYLFAGFIVKMFILLNKQFRFTNIFI